MIHEFIVEELKTRLDKYLVGQLQDVSRSQIQRDIEDGKVLVNGESILESKFVVRLGDTVVCQHSANQLSVEITATNTALKILYNNHGLLIIDKPAGMVVHPGAGFKGETLASALLYQFADLYQVGEDHRPGIVHRLDKDTSGVILVARTQTMYEHLKNAFAQRKIKKEYIALVLGRVEKPHGFIETPIGKSKTDFRKQTTVGPLEAKEALTEYKVLEYLKRSNQPISQSSVSKAMADKSAHQPDKQGGVDPVKSAEDGTAQRLFNRVDEYTLLLVKLHTGRTHQIRVHLASLGHPLMGDSLYGSKKCEIDGLDRQFLHAKKIEVELPDGTWIEAESEIPSDLRQVLIILNSKSINNL